MHAAFQPTDEQRRQVRAMAGFGMRQEQIALVVGIAPKTLRLHFRHELDVAAIMANFRIAEALYHQAIAGNVTEAIFWLKTRAGWSEKRGVEVSGAGATPMVVVRWADVSVEEAEAEAERDEAA